MRHFTGQYAGAVTVSAFRRVLSPTSPKQCRPPVNWADKPCKPDEVPPLAITEGSADSELSLHPVILGEKLEYEQLLALAAKLGYQGVDAGLEVAAKMGAGPSWSCATSTTFT